jgi:hypothetical protein
MRCPRCGRALESYELGASESVVCENCSYIGVSADHTSEGRKRESWDDAFDRFYRKVDTEVEQLSDDPDDNRADADPDGGDQSAASMDEGESEDEQSLADDQSPEESVEEDPRPEAVDEDPGPEAETESAADATAEVAAGPETEAAADTKAEVVADAEAEAAAGDDGSTADVSDDRTATDAAETELVGGGEGTVVADELDDDSDDEQEPLSADVGD